MKLTETHYLIGGAIIIAVTIYIYMQKQKKEEKGKKQASLPPEELSEMDKGKSIGLSCIGDWPTNAKTAYNNKYDSISALGEAVLKAKLNGQHEGKSWFVNYDTFFKSFAHATASEAISHAGWGASPQKSDEQIATRKICLKSKM